MSLRWEDEDFVKLYTRDTAESIDRGWEARALTYELMRKVDKAGVLKLGRRGPVAIAAIVRMPEDVVLRAFDVLVEDGTIEHHGTHIVLVNYVEAQAARSSDKLRKAQERARARDVARAAGVVARPEPELEPATCAPENKLSRPVTRGHAASHDVTLEERRVEEMRGETRDGLASVEPPPIPTSDQPNTKPKPKRAKRSPPPEVPLPAGWAPSAELLSWARNTQAVALPEAVVYAEADKFRDRALAKGTEHVDWDAAFRTWLRNARKYDPSLPRALPIPPGGPPPLPPPRPEIAEAAAQLELDSTPRDYRDALRGFGTLGGGQT